MGPEIETEATVPGRPDIEADCRNLWNVLSAGGIALIPSHVGYALWATTADATRRIIEGKGRGTHKRQGMMMGRVLEREIHVLDTRKRDMIDCVTVDYDLPLGVIARYDADHPIIAGLDPYLRSVGTARGTISTALNASPLQDIMGAYCREQNLPIFASSANLTGRGVKYRVEDIEPEIIALADMVLDYGLSRYHSYLISTTQINFETMQVTRMGACYELVCDILQRHFGWTLPSDPGRTVNRSGLVDEFALAGVE